MPPLKLCVAASEAVPFAKTGGLADMVGALVRQLSANGHDVRAFMPLYASVRSEFPQLVPIDSVGTIRLALGGIEDSVTLWEFPAAAGEPRFYFIDCPAQFERSAIYTQDADEHRRFIVFTRAVIEACQRLRFSPDVFHVHDWHTSFLPLFLRTAYAWDRLFAQSKSVLTIHNIGYQGQFAAAAVADLGLDGSEALLDPTDFRAGVINALKTGILYADSVTTVSPTYAQEICTSELGMGLQTALSERADGVTGILNGVDYSTWDPRIDSYLRAHFRAADLRGKVKNKRRLIERNELNVDLATPVISMVTRLAEQKGLDLLEEPLPQFLEDERCALVVLGSGDERYADFFRGLAQRYPGQMNFHEGYDEARAHLFEAGGDMFLMPSRYEPCGLNQMYSLRYGTVPIVRNTGGLADSVQHFDPGTGRGTGVVFDEYTPSAVSEALGTALEWYEDKRLWRRLVRNGMAKDYSWPRQLIHYEALYSNLVSNGGV